MVRQAVAADVVVVGWINTKWNLADAMTKQLTMEARNRLFDEWTFQNCANYFVGHEQL